MKMAKHAKAGGEIGANGESYKGGQFINTIAENAKVEGSKPVKPRKVQIECYLWVIDTRRPIFSLVGDCARYADQYNPAAGIVPCLPRFVRGVCSGRTLAEVQTACDRFNAGERWL